MFPAPHKSTAPRSKAKLTGDEKVARAQLALLARSVGTSIQEIADMFGVMPSTVSKDLKLAKASSPVLSKAIEIIAAKCVPKAIGVYDYHLDVGSLDAAHDVLFGMGVLRQGANMTIEVGPTLDDIRAELNPPVEQFDDQEG
jgi:hypothetical protein